MDPEGAQMRPDAATRTEPTRSEGPRSVQDAHVRVPVCAICTKHEFAVDGLTQALARLRRSAGAIAEENADLRAELSALRARGITASR